MGDQINNKVAVVTGGANGIGFAIAEELLKEGVKTIFLIDNDDNRGTESAKILNSKFDNSTAIFLRGDVTKDLDKIYDEIVEKHSNVDILVNNAGIVDETSIRRTMDINAVATVEWTMKFYENMRKDKGGKGGTILNMCSIFGYTVCPNFPFYKASKFAVLGFTRTIGHSHTYELTGVRVIALCPGLTNTNLGNEKKFLAVDILEESLNLFLDTAPSQEKEDVAKAAIEVIKIAKSGSAWNVINGEPIKEVL